MGELAGGFPGLDRIRAGVAGRPNVAAYLASDDNIPFSEHGIFRSYPELNFSTVDKEL
jgi:glutathione S-transferase